MIEQNKHQMIFDYYVQTKWEQELSVIVDILTTDGVKFAVQPWPSHGRARVYVRKEDKEALEVAVESAGM